MKSAFRTLIVDLRPCETPIESLSEPFSLHLGTPVRLLSGVFIRFQKVNSAKKFSRSPSRGSAIMSISLHDVGGDLLWGDPALCGNHPSRILQRIMPRAASYLRFDTLQPTAPSGR